MLKYHCRSRREITTAKKRNLFEEIREGLEAYRARHDILPRFKLSALEVKASSLSGMVTAGRSVTAKEAARR